MRASSINRTFISSTRVVCRSLRNRSPRRILLAVDPAIAPAKWSKNGVNTYEYRNVRLAALWKPNDDFKAQLSYYYQRAAAGGFPYVATQSAAYNQWISPNTSAAGH